MKLLDTDTLFYRCQGWLVFKDYENEVCISHVDDSCQGLNWLFDDEFNKKDCVLCQSEIPINVLVIAQFIR